MYHSLKTSKYKASAPRKSKLRFGSDVSAVPFPQFGSDFSGKKTPPQKNWTANFQFGFCCAFQFGSLKPPGFLGCFSEVYLPQPIGSDEAPQPAVQYALVAAKSEAAAAQVALAEVVGWMDGWMDGWYLLREFRNPTLGDGNSNIFLFSTRALGK